MAGDINIYVLTHHRLARLWEKFSRRYQENWGDPYFIYVSNKKRQQFSDGVLDFLNSIQDEYFILLHEDFYFTRSVKKELLEKLKKFAVENEADRVSLLGNYDPERTFSIGDGMVQWKDNAEYLYSFSASIQKREFLLKYLHSGWEPGACERENLKIAINKGHKVYSSEEPVVFYDDALRGDQIRQEVYENGV